MGASVVGNIDIVGDQDWFKVNLKAGASYNFSLARMHDGLTDPYLALYDATGTLVTDNNDSGVSQDSQILYSANLSGTYYLSAQGNGAGTGAYVLSAANATSPTVVPSYTVPGTLGNDFFLLSGGNRHLGGGGNDTYIISSHTLSGTVTAKIIDTEGSNVIQLTDGLTIASSSFYSNATQLTLSNGAKVQILGAAAFSYGVGANVLVGDMASSLTYAQFASMLGASVPTTGSTPVSGALNYQVPTSTSAAIQMVDTGSVGIGISLTGVNGLDVSHVSGMLII
ncbi:MAG: PPC domain-containing protein [Rhodoferax sp.]|nr:PPC domain-containing protein [Rhodoferax sp.]